MDTETVVAVSLLVVFPVTVGLIAFFLARRKQKLDLAAFAARQPARPERAVPAGQQRPPSTVEELGPVVQRYVTDNNRRAVTGLAAFAGGVIVLAFAIPVAIAMIDSAAASNPCGGIVIGAGGGAFGGGIVLGMMSWLRRGETFDVHERGLVHSYAGRSRLFGWSQFADVKPTPFKEGWFARVLGREGHTRFLTGDGRKVVVTGFTPGVEFLVHAVERAVFHGETPGAPSVPCTICGGTGRYGDGGPCDVCGGTGRSTRSGRDVVG
ncbi:hypothetical protein [Phytomonospora endophytica]|uniref:Uncharacterized protein n=1 Tax=Phytomonospora endophytica TaxID=714109 RepID=A0A841FMN7_9ACTN|nr:hypothetical protein [Phytomonospora endophytica]MBB6034477.1 hypothetical protein [Phytomonospora endophytica]GIG70383.1 hypothetical protein Pen01_66780 [Phytomonospora endophytica]